EPGGKHVMLIGPEAPSAGAETFPLTLVFENGGRVEVAAPVSGLGFPGGSGSP
ncbi:MAG: copper chaperone PCu(A)C, partial [Acidobacteria bacterium]|nr:copper chaperone PCu(A)C [Acidobacteriota bacterium]